MPRLLVVTSRGVRRSVRDSPAERLSFTRSKSDDWLPLFGNLLDPLVDDLIDDTEFLGPVSGQKHVTL
jgi:hypothetical protein